ncbi:Peptidase S59, nucleoporin [Phytophthora cactorum]|nr:Peptidase S59, nucleoporin [Phytophthora cactorum]
MSLFASTINPAPAANGSITFGPQRPPGSGALSPPGLALDLLDLAASSTRRCFARNGKVAATSEWTPPKPPSRPLFQSSSGFHSSLRDRVPLFGQSTQSTTLFGASGSNSSGNEATVGGGGFTFGFAAPATKTDALFGTANAGFGGDVGQETTTTLFGNTDNVSESRVDPGFVATRKVFGNSGGFLEASRENSGFGETRTVFGSPPLALSWNPFASSTKQVGISSNPFAPTSPSTSNPFTFTPPPRSTGNPLATKMSANASVNPFVTKVSANTTVNPFAVKASSNASVNPFAVKTSSNVTVESVRDTSKKLSSVPGSSSSLRKHPQTPTTKATVTPHRLFAPVLLNQEYFTKPSLSELQQLAEEELSRVENFVIGRWGCGKITFIGAVESVDSCSTNS